MSALRGRIHRVVDDRLDVNVHSDAHRERG
jgi:hypothetical protein